MHMVFDVVSYDQNAGHMELLITKLAGDHDNFDIIEQNTKGSFMCYVLIK